MLGGLIVDFGGVLTDPDADRLLAAVAGLRECGVRIGLLSNLDRLTVRADLFDDVLLAGEREFGKPDIRIYLLAADRLKLTAEQCVFVDDVAANVHGAVRAGMVGIHHRDAETTLFELTALFGVSFPE